MSDEEFQQCTATALRLTRAVMAEFSLSDHGVDEIELFNFILKQMVSPMLDSHVE